MSRTSGPGVSDLHVVVREELKARKWTRRAFADKLGVRETTAGRWLSESQKLRKVPLPSTVVEIALLLELDPADLLRRAGHLPMTKQDKPEHPRKTEIRARKRRFARILEGVDLSRFDDALTWADIHLDGLQAMASRLEPRDVPAPE